MPIHRELDDALAGYDQVDRVEDPACDRAKAWAALGASTRSREEAGLFQVEGLRAVEWLARSQTYPVAELILAKDEVEKRELEMRVRVARLVSRFRELGVPMALVNREVFRKIAGVKKIRGVMAIARSTTWSFDDLARRLARSGGVAVAAVGLADPGNLGTLIRSGVAFGVEAFFAVEGSSDPYHPKTLRSAAGHMLPAVRGRWREFRDACHKHGVLLMGLDVGNDAQELSAVKPPVQDSGRAVCVCVGSEGAGFPSGVEGFDLRVRISMDPAAESLNAGVAGSLVLWSMRGRQGRAD